MNPFKPTAGKMPPILIGRQQILDDFKEALANGAGAPGRIMLITGQRGYGKTVLLTELRKIAQAQQWQTISETASEGLVERLLNTLATLSSQESQFDATFSPSVNIAGVGSLSIGQARVSSQQAPLTLREALLNVIENKHIKKGKGLLITIDETQAIAHDDLVALATAVQHVITTIDEQPGDDTSKKGIAIVFAGLPSMVNELTHNRVTTFLRRALHKELHAIAIPDIKNAYIETITDSGMSISQECALKAAKESAGYPYMIQLIGYYMWQAAHTDRETTITERHLQIGLNDALIAFDDAVCEPVLHELTASEIALLETIAAQPQEDVTMADLITATGKSRSWVNKYRAQLLARNIIESPERGVVRISVPHLRSYLSTRA